MTRGTGSSHQKRGSQRYIKIRMKDSSPNPLMNL